MIDISNIASDLASKLTTYRLRLKRYFAIEFGVSHNDVSLNSTDQLSHLALRVISVKNSFNAEDDMLYGSNSVVGEYFKNSEEFSSVAAIKPIFQPVNWR